MFSVLCFRNMFSIVLRICSHLFSCVLRTKKIKNSWIFWQGFSTTLINIRPTSSTSDPQQHTSSTSDPQHQTKKKKSKILLIGSVGRGSPKSVGLGLGLAVMARRNQAHNSPERQREIWGLGKRKRSSKSRFRSQIRCSCLSDRLPTVRVPSRRGQMERGRWRWRWRIGSASWEREREREVKMFWVWLKTPKRCFIKFGLHSVCFWVTTIENTCQTTYTTVGPTNFSIWIQNTFGFDNKILYLETQTKHFLRIS